MATLHVRTRGKTLSSFTLTDHPLSIGRADTCDVVLRNDAEVSREHAVIWRDEDGCVYVTDRNSKNGTRADEGEPFRNATRTVRKSVRIGEHDLDVEGAQAPAKTSVRFVQDPPTYQANASFYPSTGKVELNQQRLGILINLGERIGGAFDRNQMLTEALDACCEALGFERGLIALKTGRGETEPPVTRNVQQDETGAYKVSRQLIRSALEEGKQAVLNDPATDLVNVSESVVRLQIRSALCVPIMNRDKILGVIYGDCIREAARYDKEDVEFLGAIARQIGVGLTNQRLLQDYVENQKLAGQIEQARRFQKRLLPSGPLDLGRATLAGYNEPSERVGGDYFDYFQVGPERVAFIIADVSGHGLPAAMLMANFQAAVHVSASPEISLPALVSRINVFCCRNTAPHEFITAVVGWLDTRTGLVEYVNAGHPHLLQLGPGRSEIIEAANSLPLGLEPTDSYELNRIEPGSGAAALLLYTDGLLEAEDANGQQLGLTAVQEALKSLAAHTPDAVLQGALGLWRGHLAGQTATDDLTLSVISLRG